MTASPLRQAPLAADEANSAERAQEMVNAGENLESPGFSFGLA
jgi:hypothetical protein